MESVTNYHIHKANQLNNKAMLIDYAELLQDSLLGEDKQKYRESSVNSHMLYDVMEFREFGQKVCDTIKKDWSHLLYKTSDNGKWKHLEKYQEELDKFQNKMFRDYCYHILFQLRMSDFYDKIKEYK